MNLFFLLHLLSFLLGSIPTGYLIARLKGINIKEEGSKNSGATNVARVVGRSAGVWTLLLDLLKGVTATLLVFFLPHQQIDSYAQFSELAAGLGFFAVFGHCFSPFLKFRGGKGVATGLGVFLALTPLATICAVLLFVAVVKKSRYVSVGSISAALAIPIFIWLGTISGIPSLSASPMLQITAVLTALLICVRHSANLSRLAAGTEPQYKTATQS